LGVDAGLENGPDRWLFGDATIAHASIVHLVTVPGYDWPVTGSVVVHISIGNGNPQMELLEASPDGPSWAGLLGYVTLHVGGGGSFSKRFLFDWKTFIGDNEASGSFWLSDFLLGGDFTLSPLTTGVIIGVTAWVAALRVGPSGTASVGFLDPATVKDFILTGFGSAAMGTGWGPIRVAEIDFLID
jgi:hypothetical protein